MLYDLVVVGGGPAGLTAGIYARTRNLSTLILEAKEPGGQLTYLYPTKTVYDYPSYIAIEAEELGRLFVDHCRMSGCEIRTGEEVVDLATQKGRIRVTSAKGTYESRAVILALGMGLFEPAVLGIPGEAEFEGRGVVYHVGNRRQLRGRRVLVVGGGDSALEIALQLAATAKEVFLIHRRETFRAAEKSVAAVMKSPVHVLLNSELTSIEGGTKAERAIVYDNRTLKKIVLEVDAVIINIGFMSRLSRIRKWGIELDGESLIKVAEDMSTNLKGVFACGDIVSYASKDKRIVTGAGEAVTAVMSAYKLIRSPWWA